MKRTLLVTLAISLLALGACDKNKRASNRLMKAGFWNVTSMSVDGVSITDLPIWSINDCAIYEDLCTAQWVLDNKYSAFYWQYNEKAETFTISRVVAPEDCEDFYTEEVEQQTYLFSGTYKVVECKRKLRVFESSETIGYFGQKVRIQIEVRD